MSSNTSSYHISVLLDKMCCRDKDFRFMATNDLMTELQRDSLKMDDDSEKKIVRILLKLLEDKNGEVQNLAVRCLGPLVLKIKENHVDFLVESLCNSMIAPPASDTNAEGVRGICGMGLKTVINEVPSNSTTLASIICKQVTQHLVQAVSVQEDVAIKLECLELLTDLLHRFGPLMTAYHENIMKLCVGQLQSPRFAVRKRAINTLSQLVTCCSAAQYEMLINHLIQQLNVAATTSDMKFEDVKTMIQCTAAISRQSNRVGEYSVKITSPLARCLQKYKDDEIQEYVLQALEILFRKCPKQMSHHLNELLPLCYACLQYDPNYAYDDADDDDEQMTGDEEEEDLDEDDEDYSDDDDMSWKVRRASAKCLEAIIATYPELLSDFYTSMASLLIRRIIEREENVRCEVFAAIITLLKQTKAFSAMHKRQQLPPSDGALVIPVVETMDDDKDPLTQLHSLIPALVRALQKQIRSRSIRTRQGTFSILKEVTLTLPGCFSNHIATLVPALYFVMRDKASTHNLRVETLIFINSLLSTHQPVVFLNHVHKIIEIAIECAEDQFYRTSSEALGLIQLLTQVIRPNPAVSQAFDFRPFVKQLYDPAYKQLLAADRDLEIKEKAIISVAQLIYTMADVLGPQLGDCLPVLADRLRNEITRLQTVKALSLIAKSPLNVDLRFILPGCVQNMSCFLRKNDRALRVASLSCLELLWKKYGSYIDQTNLSNTMSELPLLISDNDLYLTQLALQLLTTILRVHGDAVICAIRDQLLPHLVQLAYSPLLHGAALESALVFWSLAARVNSGDWNFQFLLKTLLAPLRCANASPNRDAYPNLAKCMAEVMRPDPTDQNLYREKCRLVDQMITDLRAAETTNNFRYLYMLCLGEIGRTVDMSGKLELMRTIQEAFDSKAEEIKTGAAMTLGKIALGKLDCFIPFIISEIQNQPKQQYFLLHSLREIISTVNQNPNMLHVLRPYMDSIWSLLLGHAACNEEGARNLVAECMGKLALMDPQTLLPRLRHQLSSAAGGDPDLARVRCTVVTAFKFTIVNVPNSAVDQILRESIKEVLQCIHDEDLNVRRAALVTFNTAAHNKPMLIRDLLTDMLPLLYRETLIRKELIREVEMGPFKHMEDDGLDLRKVAFECMYTLLDTCLDRIDIFDFLSHVEHGLKDHSDILMLTHLMLVRLCTLVPNAVYQRMEQLLAPLKMTLTGKMRADPVKQEVEKQSELKRAALRVVVALMKLPDADKHRQLNEFLKTTIHSNHELSHMFQSVEKDVHTRQE